VEAAAEGGGGGAGAGAVTVQFDREGTRDDVRDVDLVIVGFAFFFGDAGPAQHDGGACVVGDHFFDVRTSIRLDVRERGRTSVATVETDEERAVAECRPEP